MIGRWFNEFSLFLGPARLRALFILVGATGLLSLILNAVAADWVVGVQTILAIACVLGIAVIVLGRLHPSDWGRWLGVLVPAFGALLLAVSLPNLALPLFGAAAGWVIAGLLLFRSRMPMQYREAVRHLRKSEFAEAVKVMDVVVKEEPDKQEHLRFRAEILRVWGKLDRAKRDYRRMTELDPESAVAFNGLAEVCLQAGQLAEALTAAQRAAELAPEEWVAHYNLGMIEDRLGESADAVAHLERALLLKVPDVRHRLLVYLYLARGYARLDDAPKAEAAIADLKALRGGLEEWDTILRSDQAETLRQAIGADVEAARAVIAGTMSAEGLAAP